MTWIVGSVIFTPDASGLGYGGRRCRTTVRSHHRGWQHRQFTIGKRKRNRPCQVERLGQASLLVGMLSQQVALELPGEVDESEIDGTQRLDADKLRQLAHLLRPRK